MDASQTILFEESGNFLLNQYRSYVAARNADFYKRTFC